LFDESFFENENDIDQLVEHGFCKSSIEYFLKYDVVGDLFNIDNSNQNAKWSPFEWSNRRNISIFCLFPDFLARSNVLSVY